MRFTAGQLRAASARTNVPISCNLPKSSQIVPYEVLVIPLPESIGHSDANFQSSGKRSVSDCSSSYFATAAARNSLASILCAKCRVCRFFFCNKMTRARTDVSISHANFLSSLLKFNNYKDDVFRAYKTTIKQHVTLLQFGVYLSVWNRYITS